MKNNRLTILGAGESGLGAAGLARANGYEVWISDNNHIAENFRHEILKEGFAFEEGGHSSDIILASGLIVKSPGISDNALIIKEAMEMGIEVISEVEFAFRHTKKPIIAITGSNGKTTTTLLIHHLLISAGIRAAVAGNVGSSLSRHVLEDEAEVFVVELSSFQLDNIKEFCPKIAVLLNITPDHLDRYAGSFEKYASAKMRLLMNMNEGIIVYNMQDQTLAEHISNVPKGVDIITTSLDKDTDAQLDNSNLLVKLKGKEYRFLTSELPLQGDHNYMNALAAIATALAFGVSEASIKTALPSFKNHPNRLEVVANIHGVDFVNDSKATNVEAVYYALGSFNKPIIWIAGGQDKGNNYAQLDKLVKEKVKAMVCLGIDNDKLIKHFSSMVDTIAEVQSTDDAAGVAYKLAQPNDVVLLSPACASFDLFDNYAQRGDFFKKSVLNLKEKLA